MASSKRERELARMRAERQAARKAAERAKKRQRNMVLASVAAVLLVLGGGGILAYTLANDEGGPSPSDIASQPTDEPTVDESPSASPSASASASKPAGGTATCEYTDSGEPSKPVDKPAASAAKADRNATIRTSQGAIQVKLTGSKAPCTVNSFVHLAAEDYFSNTPCHRLTTEGIFVLQCGDPTGQGTGGPGYQFADENLTGATYPRGTLAMANAGPGTNGSQFFLVYKDTQLPPNYTPFGTITGGLAAIDAIAKEGTVEGTPDGKPKRATVIQDVVVS